MAIESSTSLLFMSISFSSIIACSTRFPSFLPSFSEKDAFLVSISLMLIVWKHSERRSPCFKQLQCELSYFETWNIALLTFFAYLRSVKKIDVLEEESLAGFTVSRNSYSRLIRICNTFAILVRNLLHDVEALKSDRVSSILSPDLRASSRNPNRWFSRLYLQRHNERCLSICFSSFQCFSLVTTRLPEEFAIEKLS